MAIKTFKSIADNCFIKYNHLNLLFDTVENQILSYADGYELIKSVSKTLSLQGITKGNMIVTYTPLSLESVVLCWACFYNGVIFVPVDHNWPKELLYQIIEETAPKLVLTDSDRFERFNGNLTTGTIVLSGKNRTKQNIPLFFEWLQESNTLGAEQLAEVYPNDLAVILYTSGSTGIPKGVMLSQQALFNSGKLVASHFGWKCNDIFMNLGDLHAMSGLRNTCFAPLHAGASFIIATSEERNHVLLVLKLINKLGIHYLGVAPTVVRQMNILFSESRQKQLSSIKAILCTGGALAKDQLNLFYHKYHKPVLNYYGLTETAGLCAGHNFNTFNPTDNSIGIAIGAELIIMSDPTNYNEEGTGELLVKSDNLMSGYFKREKETELVLKDGFFCTGDIVHKRDDGCYELLGRKRNIIKNLHSELIYLEEIDIALESHPMIQEACTCSYSLSEEDEKIVAFIVLKYNSDSIKQDSTAEIKKHLIDKVGKTRMPWCYYFEESLPRNTMGKIQRHLLKEKLHEYIQSNRKRYF